MENKESNQLKEAEKLNFVRDRVLEELDDLSAKFDKQMSKLGYGNNWSEKAGKIRRGEKLDREQVILDMAMNIAFPKCSPAEYEYVMKELFKPLQARERGEEE